MSANAATGATDVGAVRARMEMDASGFNTSLEKAKQSMKDSASEAKRVTQDVKQVSKALSEAGVSSKEVRNIQRELRSTNPKLLEQQLRSVEVGLTRLGASASEIEKIKRQMQATQSETIETRKSVEEMSDTVEGLGSVLASIGAGAAFAGLAAVVRTFVGEAQEMNMSVQGLAEVSKSLGYDIKNTTGLAQELADKGFMSIAQASSAVKTLLTTGLNLEQTKELILATADAAAYNRESHLSWGEAIVQVTQGIKTGNSDLTDAAGITTNLSVMYDRYAEKLGKSATNLTEAEKTQAAYNGILGEAALFAGNADAALDGYAGTQANWNKTIQTAEATLGEAFLPILQETMETLTPLIVGFASWASENKELVAGLTAGTLAMTGLLAVITTAVTVIYALRTAAIALEMSLGPIGWAVAAIGLAAGAFAAYTASSHEASEEAKKFANNQEMVNQKLNEAPIALKAEEYKKMKENIEQLSEVLERRNQLEEEINQRMNTAQSGQGSIENTNRIWELADALKEVDKELKDMSYENVDEATASLREMEAATKGALSAVLELESENVRQLSSQVKQIDNINKLKKQYDDLSKKEKLSASDKTKLASVVEELKRQYPGLNVLLDEEGRWHIKNADTLKEYITAEGETVKAAAEGSKERIETAKKEAEARLKILKSQLPAMEAFEKHGTPNNSALLPDSLGGFVSGMSKSAFDNAKKNTYNEINATQAAILDAERKIKAITQGNLSAFDVPTSNTTGEGEKEKGKKGKTIDETQNDQYQASLKFIDRKRTLNQMSEEQELTALERLQERYKNNAEIRQDLEVRVYQLKQQMAAEEEARQETISKNNEAAAQKQFEASKEWIEAEERRMREKGATEEEVSQMQLTAWTRVRSRYEKDSEYYKQADKEMYSQRMTLIDIEAQAQKDAAEERDKQVDELTNNLVKSLEKQKKAELDALEDRRKKIEEFYEDQTEALDDADRAKERNDLLAQIEQYKNATSEKGQKKLNELKEQLRKMDIEDEKRRLTEQRDDQLKSLDQQKDDIESWYDDLIEAVKAYSGDMRSIYQLTEDSRFTAFSTTNQKILTELGSFMLQYNKIMDGYSDIPSNNANVANQMQANAIAWHNASAEDKKKLEASSQQLGSSIGATYNSKTGKWTAKDGTPLFHTGRDTSGNNFRSGDTLMPDELRAIIRNDEYVLTPNQMRTLVGSMTSPSSARVVNNYNGPLVEHSGDVYVEDKADIQTYHQEQNQIARQLLARGERAE